MQFPLATEAARIRSSSYPLKTRSRTSPIPLSEPDRRPLTVRVRPAVVFWVKAHPPCDLENTSLFSTLEIQWLVAGYLPSVRLLSVAGAPRVGIETFSHCRNRKRARSLVSTLRASEVLGTVSAKRVERLQLWWNTTEHFSGEPGSLSPDYCCCPL